MSEVTELVELPPAGTALQVYQQSSGLEPWLQRIRDQVMGIVPDVSTDKGRKEIASRAFKVRKSKTALDGLGKKLVDDLKDVPRKIDAERKRMRDTLDALADEVRRPLTEWEQAEEERISAHREAISWMKALVATTEGSTADDLRARVEKIEQVEINPGWEEFEAEAARTKDGTLSALREALAARGRHEAEQAELQALRIQAAAQAQKDREAQIARDAADKAKRDAEARAQAEHDAAAKREADAKAAAARRELELKLIAANAEREKLEAQQQAEQARIDAKAQAERAAAAERQRQADEKASEQAEARRREADKAHKATINNAALAAFMQNGMPQECAKQAVILIAKGVIPAVTISY